MKTIPIPEFTAADRRLIRSEIQEALHDACPELPEEELAVGVMWIEANVDALVAIVRRSTALRIEPYLAQIHDDICRKCPKQEPSAFCSLRYEGKCILYNHAGPVVAAMRRALREIDIAHDLCTRRPYGLPTDAY